MTGMVAVIAHDRRNAVTEAEIAALAACYESVLGAGMRHATGAGHYARLIKIDDPGADWPGIHIDANGWAAITGVLYGAQSPVGADLGRLDGPFALVTYDCRIEQVIVATDPFGLQPLYAAERDGKTYISTSALAVARHLGAGPDQLGLAVLLCCGSQYGSITNWAGIERLAPATAITFDSAKAVRSTYWRLKVDETVARMSFRDSVDHAIEVISSTFQQRFSGRPRIWADVTGGFDTRLMNLLLARAGVDFCANTVGEPGSQDVRLGRRVARVAGWDWRRFDVPENWEEVAPAYVLRALQRADGRLPVLRLSPVLYVHEQQGRAHFGHVAAGGGENLGGYSWAQEFFNAGRTTRVNFDSLLRMRMLKGTADSVIVGQWAGQVYDYLLQQSRMCVRPFSSELNTFQLDILLAARRVCWDGAFAAASSKSVRSEMPFMSKPVYGAAASINFRYRQRRIFMRAMIERLSPRIAAIPTTGGGTAQPLRLSTAHHVAPYYARMARRVVAKVSVKALGRELFEIPTEVHSTAAASLKSVLNSLDFRPDSMQSASLYRPGTLEDILRRGAGPHFKQSELLDRILTVELTMRATAGQ